MDAATALDGWLLSQDATCAVFHSMSAGADISIIEGCWGMFDSPTADGTEQGSTAQVAQWLHVPVVLIIDAQAFSNVRALLALIQGYTAVDCTVPIAGVILNKVLSKSLATELQEALSRSAVKVAVLGAVPKVRLSAKCTMCQDFTLHYK
jgi:cobyrinic acid a,c-diamide synthase